MKMKNIIKKHEWTIIKLFILFWVFAIILSCIAFIIGRYHEHQQINFIESLYFVIMTMTTLGGDVILSSTIGRLYTIFLAIAGLFIFFTVLFPLVLIPWMEKQMQEGLPTKASDKLEDHIIICGYNEMVESLVHELEDHAIPFIVIDDNEHHIRTLHKDEVECLFGDPTDEDVLTNSKICKAKLIIANCSDEKNANIILSAKERCDINIIAIVNDKNNIHYLKYAGANRVISPKALLGSFIGRKAVAPLNDRITGSTHFMTGLEIAEFPIYPRSPLLKKSLKESRIGEFTGANIVGIWINGTLSLNPGSDEKIKRNSILLAVGNKEQLKKLKRLTH